MTSTRRSLRVETPVLEPDDAFVGRLAAGARLSVAPARRRRLGVWRVALVTAGVVTVTTGAAYAAGVLGPLHLPNPVHGKPPPLRGDRAGAGLPGGQRERLGDGAAGGPAHGPPDGGDRRTDRPTHRPTYRRTERQAERPADRQTERPADRSSDRIAERSSDAGPADRQADQSSDAGQPDRQAERSACGDADAQAGPRAHPPVGHRQAVAPGRSMTDGGPCGG